MFGEITQIRGQGSFLDTGVEWQYVLTGETESGVLFTAKNSTRAILDNTARIFGSRGWVEIPEYWKARRAIFHLPEGESTLEFPCEHELAYEAEHIKDCIGKGLLTSPVVTPELSVAGISALCKVKEQWKK